jgi:hypothetical protein
MIMQFIMKYDFICAVGIVAAFVVYEILRTSWKYPPR